jgi:flagellar biosynthesis component FlhA
MGNNKAKQEISVIGRLFSMEALLVLMGLISLGSGIVTGQATQIFFGVVILAGSVALYFVRKKDWEKHWEELEAESKERGKDMK